MSLPVSKSCISRALEVSFAFLLQVYAIFYYLLTCLNPLAKPDLLFGYALSLKFLKLLFFNPHILPSTFYFVPAVSNFPLPLSLSLCLNHTFCRYFLQKQKGILLCLQKDIGYSVMFILHVPSVYRPSFPKLFTNKGSP
jgi:hypothetical protein